MRRFSITLLLVLVSGIAASAQESMASAPEMATGMRQSGKIYVVVLVLATIFAGIIAFLIHMDRKLSRIEQERKGMNQ